MKRRIYLLTATLLASVLTTNVWAQNWQDVTSTYLQNAGFDESTDWETGNVATASSANSLAVSKWTSNVGDAWTSSATFGFGGTGQINGAAIPGTNSEGNAAGGCLGISTGWSGTVIYTQTAKVNLPAGSYRFSAKAMNVFESATQNTSKLGVKVGSGSYQYSTKNSWTYNVWEDDVVQFTVAESSSVEFSIGLTAISGGSGSNAKVVFDYVKLEINNDVDKTALKALITEAEGLYDAGKEGASDFLTVINTAKAVRDNASATAGEVVAAESALQNAMDAFKWANASAVDPIILTSWIKNPGFEAGTGEWTLDKTMSGWVDCTINTTAPSEGNNCYNLWAAGVTSIDLHQDVTLPRGIYELAADFRIDNMGNVTDQGVYAKVGEKTSKSTSTITNVASTWNSKEGWNNISVQFTVLEKTAVCLGASSTGPGDSSAGWFQVDNFTLKCIGQPSDDAAKQAVMEEIESVKAMLDEYDGKVGTAVATNISDARSAANALTETSTLDECNDALELLKAAKNLAEATSEPYQMLKQLIDAATLEKTHSTADDKTVFETAISDAKEALNSTDAATINGAYTDLETAREAYVDVAVPESGYSFNYNYKVGNISKTEAWTSTTGAQNRVWKNSTEKNTAEYIVSGFYENWNSSNYSGKISTTLTDLRPGHYYVYAYAFDNNKSGKVNFYAGTEKKALSDATEMLQMPVITDVLVGEEGKLEVGLEITDDGANWVGISMIGLSYLSEMTDEDKIPAAKAALLASLNDAPGVTNANVGENAFQIPTSARNTYATAKDIAQEVYDNPASTLSEVQNAKTTFDAAVEAYKGVALNAPAADKRYNMTLLYGGWDYDGKAVTYVANDRTDHGNYNIKYILEPNANYAQAFKFTAAGEKDTYYLSQIDNDGNERYICTGSVYGGNASQLRTTTTSDDALKIKVIATTTDGKWNLWNTEANQYIGSQDAGFYTVNSHTDFALAEAAKASVTINIDSKAEYATFCAPFNVAIPSGVTASKVTGTSGNTLTLQAVETTIPANTPVILYKEGGYAGGAISAYGLGKSATYTDGLLTGVYVDTDAPAASYVLQYQNETTSFYVVEDGNQPTVKANHAYLTVSSDAKELFIVSDDATAIDRVDVNGQQSTVNGMFNLAGQKVGADYKGIVIVNGKKYLNK